jgi:hypothetical protein
VTLPFFEADVAVQQYENSGAPLHGRYSTRFGGGSWKSRQVLPNFAVPRAFYSVIDFLTTKIKKSSLQASLVGEALEEGRNGTYSCELRKVASHH